MTPRRALSKQRISELASDLSFYLAQPDNKGASSWLEPLDLRPVDRAKILTALKDLEDETGIDADSGRLAPKKPARKVDEAYPVIRDLKALISKAQRKSARCEKCRCSNMDGDHPSGKCSGRHCEKADTSIPCGHPLKLKKARKRIERKVRVRKLSKKVMVRKCDQLWADLIKRDGKCFFVGKIVNGKAHVCVGGLQAMHLISRRFHATRWRLDNGLPGCAGVHMLYTCNPEAWGLFLVRHWGIEKYEEMLATAQKATKPDLAVVHEALTFAGKHFGESAKAQDVA